MKFTLTFSVITKHFSVTKSLDKSEDAYFKICNFTYLKCIGNYVQLNGVIYLIYRYTNFVTSLYKLSKPALEFQTDI